MFFFFSSRRRHTRSSTVSWAGDVYKRQVLGDAFVFDLAADHEAGDVLQEHQRHLALAAQLDEVRTLLRAFAEQDAVVGHDAHRHACLLYTSDAAAERSSVDLGGRRIITKKKTSSIKEKKSTSQRELTANEFS